MYGILVLTLALGAVSSEHPRRFIFPFGGGGGGGGGGGVPGGFGGSGSGTYRACVPSQVYCALQCDTGYVKGPMGCDFCMCNSNHGTTAPPSALTKQPVIQTSISALTPPAPALTPSIAPTTSDAPTTAAAPTTSAPGVSTMPVTDDKCTLATTLCTARCPEGYLTDPTDCTFCVCKSLIPG